MQNNLPATYATTVGFDAITVALLGRANPWGILFGGILLGALRAGAPLMQISAGVPIQMIDILQGVILFFLAADLIVRWVFRISEAKGTRCRRAQDRDQQLRRRRRSRWTSLFDIPILGILFQLVDYMIRVLTLNGAVILALAAPIALGAYCGFMNERSGVVNIGIEGMMIAAAFAGWFVSLAVVTCLSRSAGGRVLLRGHPGAAHRCAGCGRHGHARLGRPRLALDHACEPTRSSVAWSSTSWPSA